MGNTLSSMSSLDIDTLVVTMDDQRDQVEEDEGKTEEGKNSDSDSEKIDYTKMFLPIREWFKLEYHAFDAWMFGLNKRGHWNMSKGFNKMGWKKPPSPYDPGVSEVLDWPLRTYQLEKGMIRKNDPALPFPTRGEFSYGYSWPAWRKAATYAGAREPPLSMSSLLETARTALDYHVSTLRSWQSDSALFATDITEVLWESHLVTRELNDTLYKTELVAKVSERLSQFYRAIVVWQKISDTIEIIIKCGYNFRGRQAFTIATKCEDTQKQYSLLLFCIHYLHWKQYSTIEKIYCEGRGKAFVLKTPVPYKSKENRSFLESVFGVPEVVYLLKGLPKDIHESGYIDYVLLNLCDKSSIGDKHVEDWDHRILAYEQAVRDSPGSAKEIPKLLQQLIGEFTMTQDILRPYEDLLVGTGSGARGLVGPPPANILDHINELEEVLRKTHQIFSEPFPDFQKLVKEGKIVEDGCSMLWEHWNSTSTRFYDKPLNQLFGFEKLFTPTTPQWDPMINIDVDDFPIDTDYMDSGMVTDTSPLAVSGHKYFQDHHADTIIALLAVPTEIKQEMDASVLEKSGLTTPKRQSNLKAQNRHEGLFKVTRKQLHLVQKLFSKSDDEDAQGQVKWNDLYKLMERIGFSIDHVGGSIIRFVPPDSAGTPFNEHRPHPETTLSAVRYRAFGKRLTERYGWDESWFARSGKENKAGAAMCAQVS